MSLYFCDSSAIIKRYVEELGHQWLSQLCDPVYGHDITISQVALVEVVATLCRKAREEHITLEQRDALISLFRLHRRRTYSTIRVTNAIYIAAGDLCRTHRLRAYDAIQLTCALALRNSVSTQNAAPIFVCADNNLLGIAALEGLVVENPNLHP